jgi:hypothetical protein
MEKIEPPKEYYVYIYIYTHNIYIYIYMNLETRLRDRPRNRWQDEAWEDGRIVGVEGWQGRVYNREKWMKLLRTARNCRILHMSME